MQLSESEYSTAKALNSAVMSATRELLDQNNASELMPIAHQLVMLREQTAEMEVHPAEFHAFQTLLKKCSPAVKEAVSRQFMHIFLRA